MIALSMEGLHGEGVRVAEREKQVLFAFKNEISFLVCLVGFLKKGLM